MKEEDAEHEEGHVAVAGCPALGHLDLTDLVQVLRKLELGKPTPALPERLRQAHERGMAPEDVLLLVLSDEWDTSAKVPYDRHLLDERLVAPPGPACSLSQSPRRAGGTPPRARRCPWSEVGTLRKREGWRAFELLGEKGAPDA